MKSAKIKLRILGSAPGMPELGKNQAAVWLKCGENNFLFDCGDNTASQLLKHNLNKDVLDAIIISHFHPDHVAGIFLVLQMLFLEGRKKPISIYLPERVAAFKETLSLFYVFRERYSYKINLKTMQELNTDYAFITAFPNKHLTSYQNFIEEHSLRNNMKCFTFLIDYYSRKIFYTSDIERIDFALFNKADLIILDALHPTINEILELRRNTQARIILNHGSKAGLLDKINIEDYEIADEKEEINI